MEKQKKILAVHDISCMGRCSLTVALPILSCAGFETSILPTALLSTHTGDFQNYTYLDLTLEMEKILHHWKSLDVTFSSIYSGFLGSYEQIALVSQLMNHFSAEGCLKLVDPAMADHGRLYPTYTKQMAEGTKLLCKNADIIVPNITEACFLLDLPYQGENIKKSLVEQLLQKLGDMGPEKVVLTGVSFDENSLGAAVYSRYSGEISYLMGPKYSGTFHGTGDVFSSVLLSGILNEKNLDESAQLAVDFTHKSIQSALESSQ
ncbi:MAG: pyridoxamine kinase, partial [Clostridiales bacterium]|nr:pyridoxamine kinase [Clostridiales bacterium]